MTSVQMCNGTIFPKERIDKLVEFIINRFADEKLSVDEAKVILNQAIELVGEFSQVGHYKPLSNISCKE